ncbi:MAG: ABC transporter permease [Actinobacteria bacterium]|nr:ABC transporter permease [Actinomycetota bacterium]
MATRDRLTEEVAGLDALDLPKAPRVRRAVRLWAGFWPKIAALALALGLWQAVVWSGWKPTYVLPHPWTVLSELGRRVGDGTLMTAAGITLRRALVGYTLAVLVGTAIGSLVSRVKLLRVATGSLITGLQTMPSIAWFPLAILIFKLSESAILFVIILGAAPAIANGLITGADHIPPLLLRAGRVLGARRLALYRYVILPASLPGFVAGMKQGWSFAWRSLMAGELLVIIARKQSIGVQLQVARDLADAPGLMATMLLILIIGIAVDSLFFGTLDRAIRRRWGLMDPATS